MSTMRHLLLLLPVAIFCVSCNPVQRRSVQVKALTTAEKEIKAVVLVNDEVVRDTAMQPVLTPATIDVDFLPDPEGIGFKPVELEVRAVVQEGDTIVRGLEEDDVLPYYSQSRLIKLNDPKIQLFFLVRNLDYQ